MSLAAKRFDVAIERIQLIRDTAHDLRIRPISRDKSQALLLASLAGYVAAWEAYLEQLVRDFYDTTGSPLLPEFHAMHTLAKDQAHESIKRFNTPNADNSRVLLVKHTGLDPIGIWVWPARRMNGVQVRERLSEILTVRHSFAHGFQMPSYLWNTSAGGQLALNWKAIATTEAFFKHLVKRTDLAMRQHIKSTYSLTLP